MMLGVASTSQRLLNSSKKIMSKSKLRYCRGFHGNHDVSTTVFVSNLSSRVKRQHLADLMKEAGKVAHIKLADSIGEVTFERPQDAVKAVKFFKNTQFAGRDIDVSFSLEVVEKVSVVEKVAAEKTSVNSEEIVPTPPPFYQITLSTSRIFPIAFIRWISTII